jgi:hypothetical protein
LLKTVIPPFSASGVTEKLVYVFGKYRYLPFQFMADLIAAHLGALAAAALICGGEAGGNQPAALQLVIEADDPVVKSDGQVRHRAIVVTRPGQGF